jgi:hypothetical protein
MSRFFSISAPMLVMVFAVVATQRAVASSGVLEERFKVSLNTVIHDVKETEDPVAKRKMLGDFLIRMDRGIGMAKGAVSEKDGQALSVLQLKLKTDYAELSGHGTVKVPDADLNLFANYVQQDVEQAAGGIYISVGGLIIILLLLILIF